MGASVVAVAAAVLGGLVSLVSVVVGQRASQRAQERAALRAAYGRLHAAVRDARDALGDCVDELEQSGTIDEETFREVQVRWRAYVVQHAEAHMTVSDTVLEALGAVNGSLRVLYTTITRMHRGAGDPAHDLLAARERLGELWDRLTRLRDAMRRELGIEPRTA